MLGVSAHAAGIQRNVGTLVGELTNYLHAVHAVAERGVKSAEKNVQYDLARLAGGTALRG
jgi:hypothetical protein